MTTVRDLIAADLPAALVINNANVPAVSEATAEELAHIFEQSAIALAVDDDPGQLAGFCLVLRPGADYTSMNYRWFGERYDDFIYLDRVAFDANAQNRGWGAAMYAEVERRATDPTPPDHRRPSWFTLEVNLRPRNDGSLRFHHRLGFEEVGQQETDYGSLVSLLAKPL